jgi:hypothetical protein
MPTTDQMITKALRDRAATVSPDTLLHPEMRSDRPDQPIPGDSGAHRARLVAVSVAAVVIVVAIAAATYAIASRNSNHNVAGQTGTLKAPETYCSNTPRPPVKHGRRSQPGANTTLVPGAPFAVTICPKGPTRPAKTTTSTTELVHALNALPVTRTPTVYCHVTRGDHPFDYDLHFHYRSGPDIDVSVVPACNPGISADRGLLADGTSTITLEATSSPAIVALIKAALQQR